MARRDFALAMVLGAAVFVNNASRAEDVLKLAVGQRGAFETSLGPLGEEAGIFNGDNGLSCEIRNQLKLFVGKRTNFLARQREGADQFVLL